MRRWLPVLVLASAQFVMVLDSTVMNVSVSAVVADLDTTVPMLQLAIASYTLIIGTALIGAVLLGGLASGFSSEVANDPRLSRSCSRGRGAGTARAGLRHAAHHDGR
jgi:MFS family permease